LSEQVTPQGEASAYQARTLFSAVLAGTAEITTSDAILAEVVFILSHPRHYGVGRSEVATKLRPLLQPRGCRLTDKAVCLLALDLWVELPKLSFPDALGAAYVQLRGYELATFDVELGRVAGTPPFAFAGMPESP
jgi:predicted nucleic acid-binding protein